MLLTVAQKYLIRCLNDFGGVTKSQAEKLLQLKYPNSTHKSEIHQLLRLGEIKEQGEYLSNKNIGLSTDNISAIDIVLLIADNNSIIQKGKKPFAVTIFKYRNEKLWRYDVCIIKPEFERLVNAELEDINAKHRTIIFLLDNPDQEKNIYVPCECCFTWKENGEYRFYKEKR